MCCGSKRSSLRFPAPATTAPPPPRGTRPYAGNPARAATAPLSDAAPPPPAAEPDALAWVTLEYTGGPAIVVRGPASGRHYAFSGARPALAVDPRDAIALARSGVFRRV
jgi:hypothetical protein